VGLFTILFVLLLVPFDWIFSGNFPLKLPLISYVRAVTGDLSISTLLLCIFGLGHFRNIQLKPSSIYLIAIFALIFYPLALGLGIVDPYAWGYHSIFLMGILALLAALFIIRKYSLEGIIISVALIAWAMQWHESSNLWDYLIDPFLAIWAITRALQLLVRNKSSII
jgi:hypothetical protein